MRELMDPAEIRSWWQIQESLEVKTKLLPPGWWLASRERGRRMSIEEFFATAATAAVGAFVAADFGFRYAMTRLKKERAFDRRPEWYENTCRLLTDVAGKLNWAAAADLRGGRAGSEGKGLG